MASGDVPVFIQVSRYRKSRWVVLTNKLFILHQFSVKPKTILTFFTETNSKPQIFNQTKKEDHLSKKMVKPGGKNFWRCHCFQSSVYVQKKYPVGELLERIINYSYLINSLWRNKILTFFTENKSKPHPHLFNPTKRKKIIRQLTSDNGKPGK